MNRVSKIMTAAAFAGATIVATSGVAGAEATVDDFEATCSSVQASGSTTAPYVGVLVSDSSNVYFLGAEAPDSDGNFSLSVSFAELPAGTTFTVAVYGSTIPDPTPSDDGGDGEAYFETTVDGCTPASTPTTAPTSSTTSSTAPSSTTSSTAAPAAAAAAATTVTPTFTG